MEQPKHNLVRSFSTFKSTVFGFHRRFQTNNNLGKTVINHPFGNELYKIIQPISGDLGEGLWCISQQALGRTSIGDLIQH